VEIHLIKNILKLPLCNELDRHIIENQFTMMIETCLQTFLIKTCVWTVLISFFYGFDYIFSYKE